MDKQFNQFRKVTYIVTSIALVLLLTTAGTLYYLYTHNFHTVIPGQVYRSRELSKNQFEDVIKKYQIKSVLNLRGAHPNDKWYQQEIDAVKATGIKHYDLPISSKKLPPLTELKQLVNIMATSPKPILVHCLSGVDRTGLASSIALILANDPISEVNKQESMEYFVLSKQSVGRQVLRKYEGWLKKNNLQSSSSNFYQWLGQLNSSNYKAG